MSRAVARRSLVNSYSTDFGFFFSFRLIVLFVFLSNTHVRITKSNFKEIFARPLQSADEI